MAYIFMGAAMVVCAIGWIKNYVGALSLSYYLVSKGYPPPSDAEAKSCSEYVVKRLLTKQG